MAESLAPCLFVVEQHRDHLPGEETGYRERAQERPVAFRQQMDDQPVRRIEQLGRNVRGPVHASLHIMLIMRIALSRAGGYRFTFGSMRLSGGVSRAVFQAEPSKVWRRPASPKRRRCQRMNWAAARRHSSGWNSSTRIGR